MSEKAGSGGLSAMPWFHRNIGRMETEKLLMESREDGAFLIRESDTVKGAYVLSTMWVDGLEEYTCFHDSHTDKCIIETVADRGRTMAFDSEVL